MEKPFREKFGNKRTPKKYALGSFWTFELYFDRKKPPWNGQSPPPPPPPPPTTTSSFSVIHRAFAVNFWDKKTFSDRTRHEEHLFTSTDVMELIALNSWSGDSHFYCESNVAQVEELEFVFKQRLKKNYPFFIKS